MTLLTLVRPGVIFEETPDPGRTLYVAERRVGVMKLLETAHGYFTTGSELADAVVQCHQDRASAFQIDTVVLPFVDGLGVIGSVRILVGWPYLITSAPVVSSLPELSDPTALDRIRYGEPENDARDDLDYVSAELDRLELPREVPTLRSGAAA